MDKSAWIGVRIRSSSTWCINKYQWLVSFLAVFLDEFVDFSNVSGLGIVLGCTFLSFPRFPFGLASKVKQSGFGWKQKKVTKKLILQKLKHIFQRCTSYFHPWRVKRLFLKRKLNNFWKLVASPGQYPPPLSQINLRHEEEYQDQKNDENIEGNYHLVLSWHFVLLTSERKSTDWKLFLVIIRFSFCC